MAILYSLPVKNVFSHVKGHQDSLLPFHLLDQLAQLKSMANDLAKQHLLLAISKHTTSQPVRPLASELWSSFLQTVKLTSDLHPLVWTSL